MACLGLRTKAMNRRDFQDVLIRLCRRESVPSLQLEWGFDLGITWSIWSGRTTYVITTRRKMRIISPWHGRWVWSRIPMRPPTWGMGHMSRRIERNPRARDTSWSLTFPSDSEDVLFGNRHANRPGSRNPFSQRSLLTKVYLHAIYKGLITICGTKLHHNSLIR
jgi:hypothetical protein